VAFALSILFHIIAFLGIGSLQQWVKRSPETAPDWAKSIVAAVEPKPPTQDPLKQFQPRPDETEIPLTFMEVDPTLASAESPKDAKFYSTENTLQANPNPQKEKQEAPQVDGKQKNIAKTFDTKRGVPQPPPPTPQPKPPDKPEPEVAKEEPPVKPETSPQPEKKPQTAAVAKPEGGQTAGETELEPVRPKAVVPEHQEPQKERPEQAEQKEQIAQTQPVRRKPIARVNQAKELKGVIEGQKMEQKGASSRMGIEASFDVRQSPFGNYDQNMIAAVQARWFALLDGRFAFERSGKVVLKFQLHTDGTVSDLETVTSDVGESLSFTCEAAILGAASFGRWPADMQKIVGQSTRPITFTFHYTTD
jgi:hypothetical protein